MSNRLDGKLILLYTLLILQIFIVMIYVITTPSSEFDKSVERNSVSFVDIETSKGPTKHNSSLKQLPTFKTISEELKLKYTNSSKYFEILNNNTICWREGSDDKLLDKCSCKQGWHGSDCGQPEVVWRAIMASKQNIKLERRKLTRRIIYTIFINNYNSGIVEAIVEELYNVVDVFVICDFNNNIEENLMHELKKGLLKNQQDKILYINGSNKLHKPFRIIYKYIWDKINLIIKNVNDDDIYIMTDGEQILNWRALMFLKVYNGWPQPIGFRLRWSVFGFFWQHPLKTTIMIGAYTVGLIYQTIRTNSLIYQRELNSDRDNVGLVIGDLNHYGGWNCHYCQTPANILMSLKHQHQNNNLLLDSSKSKSNTKISNSNIDVLFIEDLIGTGLWIDGKTNLQRAYKSRDPYFAPETIIANTFKYDWLVENFYAKLDYY